MEVSRKTIEEIDWSKEKENIRLIESILFISGRFLSIQELMGLSELNSMVILEGLKKLREKHNKEDSSLEILERDNLWKMDVRSEYHYLVNKLAGGSQEFTTAEQGTLAIIAYKQPIKQSVIIKIRGNKAYDHINKFVKLGLLKSKKEGHTNILTLSDEFYDYFSVAAGSNNVLKEKVISRDDIGEEVGEDFVEE
jgi:segregation and condensation protein B